MPNDLCGAVLWLVWPASQFVNGVVIPIDGGFSGAAASRATAKVYPGTAVSGMVLSNATMLSWRGHPGVPNDGWLLRAGVVWVGASGSGGISLRFATLRNS